MIRTESVFLKVFASFYTGFWQEGGMAWHGTTAAAIFVWSGNECTEKWIDIHTLAPAKEATSNKRRSFEEVCIIVQHFRNRRSYKWQKISFLFARCFSILMSHLYFFTATRELGQCKRVVTCVSYGWKSQNVPIHVLTDFGHLKSWQKTPPSAHTRMRREKKLGPHFPFSLSLCKIFSLA